jgi:hypothetical protein
VSRPPTPGPEAVPFPYGRMRQPPSLPSLEEQVRELTKKVKWLKWENEELQRKNRSLETQLRKFYR